MNNMDIKKEIYVMIEQLPEQELDTVRKIIESLLLYVKAQEELSNKEFLKVLENAPYDDEPETEEEIKATEEAYEDIKAGRVKPWAQVKEEMGL